MGFTGQEIGGPVKAEEQVASQLLCLGRIVVVLAGLGLREVEACWLRRGKLGQGLPS